MSRTSFSSITIILFVIILSVGLGGGYLFASSNLQPKIDDLTKQLMNKSTQINTLNTQLTDKNTKITQLNTTVDSLQSQVAGLIMDKQIQAAKISFLTDTIEERDTLITVLNGRVTPSSGFMSVNMYGFSFEAPMNLTLTTVGLQDAVANSKSGVVKMSKSDSELFSLSYIYRTVAPDIDASIDAAEAALSSYNPQYGPRITVEVYGGTMKYERYTATDSNGVFFGVIGYVYCSKLNYYFGISGSFYNGAQTMLVFDHLLHSLYTPN